MYITVEASKIGGHMKKSTVLVSFLMFLAVVTVYAKTEPGIWDDYKRPVISSETAQNTSQSSETTEVSGTDQNKTVSNNESISTNQSVGGMMGSNQGIGRAMGTRSDK
jgi:hypothetical protein